MHYAYGSPNIRWDIDGVKKTQKYNRNGLICYTNSHYDIDNRWNKGGVIIFDE